jgi:hypothetical protein
MASPLETYNKVATDLNISDDLNIPVVARLGFAREQASQMKQIVNRLVFDLTMTKLRQAEAKDEDTVAAYGNKVAEYERDLRQTRDGLISANTLVKELEEVVAE